MKTKIFILMFCIFAFACNAQISGNGSSSGSVGLSVTAQTNKTSPLPVANPQSSAQLKMFPSTKMSVEQAKEILIKTPIITSAKFGKYATNQSRALSVIIHCKDKSEQSKAIRDIYKNAKFIEGKLYAMIALSAIGDKDTFSVLKESFNSESAVRVLVGRLMRSLTVEKIFASLESGTSFYVLKYVPIDSIIIE